MPQGIPDISTEEDLQILLSPFPNVTSVRLVKNKETEVTETKGLQSERLTASPLRKKEEFMRQLDNSNVSSLGC
eukprot:scaffold195638_cov13-Tisochrysis_lutea.AAC.1